jgi:hypothetical protein
MVIKIIDFSIKINLFYSSARQLAKLLNVLNFTVILGRYFASILGSIQTRQPCMPGLKSQSTHHLCVFGCALFFEEEQQAFIECCFYPVTATMPKASSVVCEATMAPFFRIVTVKYPESVFFCKNAEAIALLISIDNEPEPLLVSPPIVPDHSVSESMFIVKAVSGKPA